MTKKVVVVHILYTRLVKGKPNNFWNACLCFTSLPIILWKHKYCEQPHESLKQVLKSKPSNFLETLIFQYFWTPFFIWRLVLVALLLQEIERLIYTWKYWVYNKVWIYSYWENEHWCNYSSSFFFLYLSWSACCYFYSCLIFILAHAVMCSREVIDLSTFT